MNDIKLHFLDERTESTTPLYTPCISKTKFNKMLNITKIKSQKKLGRSSSHASLSPLVGAVHFNKVMYKQYYEDLVMERTYNTIQEFVENQLPSKEVVASYIPISDDVAYNTMNIRNAFPSNICAIFSNKNTHALSCFPSSCKFYDTQLENRITFKLNNKLYLNFSKIQYASNKNMEYMYVSINYNHSSNRDMQMELDTINSVIHELNSM
jgi:hypothetical protein